MKDEELERLYKAAHAKNKKKRKQKFEAAIEALNFQPLDKQELIYLRRRLAAYTDFETLKADSDFRKEIEQKLTKSSSKETMTSSVDIYKVWQNKFEAQYRQGKENIKDYYPYAEAALGDIYFFCLAEVNKDQDEKKAHNLLNLFTGIQTFFALDNNDIDSVEKFQESCNTLKEKCLKSFNMQDREWQEGILKLFQFRVLQLNQGKFNQETLKNFPDLLGNFKTFIWNHAFINGIKDFNQYYRKNPNDFPLLILNGLFYFPTDKGLMNFFRGALSQAITKEDESGKFEIKVDVEEAFLRQKPSYKRQSSYTKFTLVEPEAKADRIVLSVKKQTKGMSDFSAAFDQGIHAFLVLNLQGKEGHIEVSGLEVKGLKRFEIAQQVFQNPLAVLFSDFENFDKIWGYSDSLKNAKAPDAVPKEQAKLLVKDPEFNSFPEAQAYASFISGALSRIDNLTIEQFKEGLQNRIERILQKQSWNAARDLSELKKCVKITFMILTGRPEILDEELKTADLDTLIYLLKFSHACFDKIDGKPWLPFITSFFNEEERSKAKQQESQKKANMIVQKILMQNNELFDLMSIIQKYILEAENNKQALNSLLVLIKNIVVDGIMQSKGDPEVLYKNLLQSKDALLSNILKSQTYPYPQERFVSAMWAVREQISSDFMKQKIREMGEALMKKIEEFDEKKCPDKKQCLALLKQAFPVQESSNRAEAGFNVTTAFKSLNVATANNPSAFSGNHPS